MEGDHCVEENDKTDWRCHVGCSKVAADQAELQFFSYKIGFSQTPYNYKKNLLRTLS